MAVHRPVAQLAARRSWRVSDRLSAEKIERMVADYRAGVSARTLAAVYGIGKGTVLQLLDQHGVDKRSQPVTAAEQQKIIAFYAQGWSLARVGEALDRNPTTIGDVLERAGIARRSPHFRSTPRRER